MGKTEERSRMDKPGLLPESVSEYGLGYARGCLRKRMAAGVFLCKLSIKHSDYMLQI